MQTQDNPRQLKVLIFAASFRADSLNKKLAALAASVAEKNGAKVHFASMHDFDVPFYDGDLEARDGVPQGAHDLQKCILENDAFIISSPEYNASIPGVLKNLIDWTSRFRPQPFSGKHGLLMSASPSFAGGNRGLWSLRIPFEHLGANIFPNMFSLATAHNAFEEDVIGDPKLQDRFEKTVDDFLALAEAAKNYPCMKKAWVEFLGEPTDSIADRVDIAID